MADTPVRNEPAQGGSNQDRSQFIRTYAKDVASLGGSVKIPAQIKIDVPKSKKPTPSAPSNAQEPAQEIRGAEESDKDAILARLKEKVRMQSQKVSVPPKLPTFPKIESDTAPLTESKISFRDRFSKELATPVEPPPFLRQTEPPSDSSSPIKTFSYDFQKQVDSQKASTFSVLASELDAKSSAPVTPIPERKQRGNTLFIVVGVVVCVMGAGILSGGIWYMMRQEPIIPALSIPSLVFADERVELERDSLKDSLLASMARDLDEGMVRVVYITSATTTQTGIVKTPEPGTTLLRALSVNAPELLLRNADLGSTAGVISANGETKPFFVFRVSSYERAFAGMLAWEKTMPDDLLFMYPSYELENNAGEESVLETATTTPNMRGEQVRFLEVFSDKVVRNHNVRVLTDESGNTKMLYGFVDRQTLIIARNETAFSEIINRLSGNISE